MDDKHKPMSEDEIARDERLCSANETLLEMLESTEQVNINDEIAARRDLADFRTTYDTGWPRALAEVRMLRKRIERAQQPIGILRGRGIGYADDVLCEVEEALDGALPDEIDRLQGNDYKRIVGLLSHEKDPTFTQCIYLSMVFHGWLPDFENSRWVATCCLGSALSCPRKIVDGYDFDSKDDTGNLATGVGTSVFDLALHAWKKIQNEKE